LSVLHAIEPKTMRLNHNIHATSQLKVMASREPRMIALIAILAAFIGQELLADGSNIVKAITMSLIGAEVAKNLLGMVSILRGKSRAGSQLVHSRGA